MRPVVRRWRPEQLKSIGTIELPNDNKMREALDIGEPSLKLRQNPEHALSLMLNAKALGNFAYVLVRATNKANRLRSKHRGKPPSPKKGPGATLTPEDTPSRRCLGGSLNLHSHRTPSH